LKWFISILGAAALTITLGLLLWVRSVMSDPLVIPANGLVLEIQRGEHLGATLERLVHDGVIGSVERRQAIALTARISGEAGRIRAGEFLIPVGSSAGDLLQILTEGRPVMHSFTIIEGWTAKQMLEALQSHEAIRVELAGASQAELLQAIGAVEGHSEGLFLPDTYHFPRGETDSAFLRRAYAAMQTFLAASWLERDPEIAVADSYQALILASIIEKETGVADERATIAGVFDRRLKLRMRLETDPTVIYGLGEAFDGNLRRDDLDRDTPYNTYTRHGLPPTPIALASPAAILAALHPEPGDALYFVATGDGRHQFSASYDEHLEAVRRYQLRRR
jgi:peptidoglycan lytic transglycosylase G